MAKPIDFSGMFRARVAERLGAMPGIDEDGAEALSTEMYDAWTHEPDERLSGLSPRQWFARLSGPAQMVGILEDYVRAHVDVPELLLDRIVYEGSGACGALEALVGDAEKPAEARALALKILLTVAPSRAQPIAADIVLAAEESSDISELAAEALGELANEGVQKHLLDAYDAAPEFAKILILEILCNFPGDNRIYMHMRDMLINRPEQRALAANLLGRLGDERAIAPLEGLIGMSDLTYFEYMEIRNAIEALGGEVSGEREFYGDPDYEYMRNLE